MVTIPGASAYLNSATLANVRGLAAQSPNVLGEGGATSILDVGRRLSSGNGIGISSSARALNDSFLNRTADINSLLSLALGPGATVEGLQQEILALRAGLRDNQLAPELRAADNGNAAASENGQAVDTEA